ncbi:MAG TPA: HlyD family efflux transporter periplasmic adaptor subunit [Steroidobacteraceae bacterium]|nr:HlyD family efflux transporter periplasmic adaptor subunit [Steroidobacteraceae bacterium]
MSSEHKSDLFAAMDVHRTQPRQRWWKLRTVWAVIAIASLLSLGLWSWSRTASGVAEVARSDLYVGTVQRGSFSVEIPATGKLVPAQSRWIAAPATGLVDQIMVVPGQRVAKGSPVVRLSNPQVANAALSAAADLAAARADLLAKQESQDSAILQERSRIKGMEVDLESAAVHLNADSTLAAQGIVSQYHYQDEKLHYGLKQQQLKFESERLVRLEAGNHALRAAERERVHQQAALSALRNSELQQLTVRSPVSGQVEEINAEAGKQVSLGASLARVTTPDTLIARLQVSQYDAGRVTPGLLVHIDTHNGFVAGRVLREDPAVKDGVVTVDVHLIGTPPEGARVDLSVDGTILINALRNVNYVARPADITDGSITQVFVLEPGGGRAERRTVHFGVSSIDRIQVLSGLQPGDRVVLSDTSAYKADHALNLH